MAKTRPPPWLQEPGRGVPASGEEHRLPGVSTYAWTRLDLPGRPRSAALWPEQTEASLSFCDLAPAYHPRCVGSCQGTEKLPAAPRAGWQVPPSGEVQPLLPQSLCTGGLGSVRGVEGGPQLPNIFTEEGGQGDFRGACCTTGCRCRPLCPVPARLQLLVLQRPHPNSLS